MHASPLLLPLASLASIFSRRTHHSLPLGHAQRMGVRMNRIQAVIGQKASFTGAASHMSPRRIRMAPMSAGQAMQVLVDLGRVAGRGPSRWERWSGPH